MATRSSGRKSLREGESPSGTPSKKHAGEAKGRHSSTAGADSSTLQPPRRPSEFNPLEVGLPAEFILTDFTRLKGCSCKVPQPRLLELLRAVASAPAEESHAHHHHKSKAPECDEYACERHRGNVGMDCSIVPLQIKSDEGKSLFMISTTDFFFPSVEDPFLQGEIGAANVLSDLYSMGITRCDTMLMLLAASTDMDPDEERYVSTKEMMKGFVSKCASAGVKVTGGQTVLNPWPIIGGVATSVVAADEMITPSIKLGDVIVLTKPLGNQLAVNLRQWLRRPSPIFKEKIEGKMTEAEINQLYDAACINMARLNRTAASLMGKHGAHGSTDITGFGVLGHATNYAEAYEVNRSPTDPALQISIHTLPFLKGALKADALMDGKYKLQLGYSAETSGGLFVALPGEEAARKYMADLLLPEHGSIESWIVGRVLQRGKNQPFAVLEPTYTRIEV